ncbi:MAG: hypothetical protein PVH73_03320 [Candidatus Bathyarchaeota archaeon]|jgi:hypothetical protein
MEATSLTEVKMPAPLEVEALLLNKILLNYQETVADKRMIQVLNVDA